MAFIAVSSAGLPGLYVSHPVDPIRIVADTHTIIPGTNSGATFASFLDFALSGTNVAFIGAAAPTDGPAASGVYFEPVDPNTPVDPHKIADTATPVPGQSASTFFAGYSHVSLAGTSIAFSASFSSGSGVYVCHPPDPCTPAADTSTVVPGGATGTHSRSFGNVAIDPNRVVFEGFSGLRAGVSTLHGIYEWTGSAVIKIVAQGDTVAGKQVSDIHFGPGGFSGNQVVFTEDFADGSQGVTVATNGGNRCPLSQGYWKNHVPQWPEGMLTLGNQNYTQAEMVPLLNLSTSDASVQLAQQLIAAKLNVFNGSNVNPASDAINGADSLLAGFAGKLPYNVKPNSTVGQKMVGGAKVLINYNSGSLTPGCAP